jgi:hypothetical protein
MQSRDALRQALSPSPHQGFGKQPDAIADWSEVERLGMTRQLTLAQP